MEKFVDIPKIFEILESYYPTHVMQARYQGQPFKVLVACILSIRNLDEITFPVADRLFQIADTPEDIVDLPIERLKAIIKPINFSESKAENIKKISKIILEQLNGEVPATMEGLLAFYGVGRKTANLVLSLGHNIPAIAVDTHVHKVTNRLGYVKTKTPEQTETALKEKLPQPYWIKINPLFVTHGKQICKTGRPWCDICPIIDYCNQIGVNPRKIVFKEA
ncbi:MAG TPA: endonuclease III [Cyanobacteria bacterium UBA9579]|nr:endonuclease III [Cyanobacteria bacterium UBA9579]